MRPLDGIETLGNKHPAKGRTLPEERNRFERLKIRAELIYFHCAVPSFSLLRYDELKI
jgi:hypothetical protein